MSMNTLLLLPPLLLASTAALEPLRAPCTPLNVVSPYQSVWSCSDFLYESWPQFWDGSDNGMYGMVSVDGVAYRWMGPSDGQQDEIPSVTQASVVVGATTTRYEFIVGDTGVSLVVNWTTPAFDLDNDDPDAQFHDRPVTYVSFGVKGSAAAGGSDSSSSSSGGRTVKVYMDLTAEMVVNDVSHEVIWLRENVTTAPADENANNALLADMRVGTTAQKYLGATSDRIDWGFAHLSVPALSSSSSYSTDDGDSNQQQQQALESAMASAETCRAAFASGDGLAGVADDSTGPRAANDDGIVLAIELDLSLGNSSSSSESYGLAMLALDQVQSMRYFGTNLKPFWTKRNSVEAEGSKKGGGGANDDVTAVEMLAAAALDAPSLLPRAWAFDAELAASHASGGRGAAFATLTSLVYRQTTGGLEKVWDAVSEQAWVFMKEISSDGDVSTLDVLFPASPFFYFYPTTLQRLLLPLLPYAANGTTPYGDPKPYEYAWAPHHLGVWPHCDLAQEDQEQMPMEESGNLLLMIAAVIQQQQQQQSRKANDGPHKDGGLLLFGWLEPYWTTLNGYADYIVASLPDPKEQLCTDDFEGPSPHNANLAAKGVVALSAWAETLRAAAAAAADDDNNGSHAFQELATAYAGNASAFAAEWHALAFVPANNETGEGAHYKKGYDDRSSWSLKYNLLPQYLLNIPDKPFGDSVATLELDFYATKIARYGIQLDSGAAYNPFAPFTKLDWSMWVAALALALPSSSSKLSKASESLSSYGNLFEILTNTTFKFANECTDRVPFSDWTHTTKPSVQGFRARPVMGGIYAALLVPPLSY